MISRKIKRLEIGEVFTDIHWKTPRKAIIREINFLQSGHIENLGRNMATDSIRR